MVRGYANSATKQGTRSYQEDKFVVIRHKTSSESGWLLGVMDGHGGDEVSIFCEQNIENIFKSLSSKSTNITSILRQLIKTLAKETKNMRSGSTISLAYISESRAKAFVDMNKGITRLLHTVTEGGEQPLT